MSPRKSNSKPDIGWFSLVCALLVITTSGSGCSNSGNELKRYHVSGTITFNGQPVPAGSIVFDPDSTAGNGGPQGYAEIVNGKFDTAGPQSQGIVGGPTVMTIIGLKEASVNPESTSGVLFANYVERRDFGRENVKVDIEVPSSTGPVSK